MMIKKLAYTLIMLISISANAGIITDTDNDSFIDNSTGLEWMDFGINNGHTFDFVSQQTIAGGIYEGWQVASAEQAYGMWMNAFRDIESIITTDAAGAYEAYHGAEVVRSNFAVLYDIMGVNVTRLPPRWNYEYDISVGWFNGTFGMSYVAYVEYTDPDLDMQFDDTIYYLDSDKSSDIYDEIDKKHSTMLVKITKVPEPSTLAIFALGLIGIASRRLRSNIYNNSE